MASVCLFATSVFCGCVDGILSARLRILVEFWRYDLFGVLKRA